ncbi:hypothetical protein K503DRAFT_777410 [Rhizopogon vinicolor AM-OR11-026]|uniref:Uncharacterized protein n=1 Tax=Rhizopogon vinicolor AM-OR11-026 TaxID=1314800 RepID=A0A1B7MGB7_9AGAM|nr:hypothetical protein K503DRAFT_777410 [Rhizopogon vinicolor AM-OR11-026]
MSVASGFTIVILMGADANRSTEVHPYNAPCRQWILMEMIQAEVITVLYFVESEVKQVGVILSRVVVDAEM